MQWLKLSAWKVGDRGFERRSGIQVSKKQNVSSPLTRSLMIQYCGESAGPRGSVINLIPPGLKFQILGPEGSVISFVSPGGSPGPV